MDATKVKSHIEKLRKKHLKLDKDIQESYNRYVDDLTIEKMKKQKLAIKDEIERLQKVTHG